MYLCVLLHFYTSTINCNVNAFFDFLRVPSLCTYIIFIIRRARTNIPIYYKDEEVENEEYKEAKLLAL